MKRKKPSSNLPASKGNPAAGAGAGASRGKLIALWLAAAVSLGIGVYAAMNWLQGGSPSAKVSAPTGPISFHKHVAPIIYNHCSTCHHPGESAPFNLLNFADVKKHAKQIAEATQSRLMPPWLPEPGVTEFVGQRYLSEVQIDVIRRWVAEGSAEGNPADAPPPPKWRDGWQLGQPDLVVQLPKPYTLPADGKDVYRIFVVPIPNSTQRYVKALEFSPGNAKAVHHAFVLLDQTRDSRRRDEQDGPEPGFPGLHTPPSAQTPDGHFLSWQPGKMPTANPDGLGWTLHKDTDLVLQIHLRPTGKPELVQPSVGFYFTDVKPTRTPTKFGLWSYAIDIPAGETNHVVRDSFKLPADIEVLRVLPHSHYLARHINAWATLPDGTEKPLIRIPSWNFDWQGDYKFAQPVFLPKGSTIQMAYTFDNSTNNARNPHNPPQRVRYGVNSSDEMAELWLQVLPRNPAEAGLLEDAYRPKVFHSALIYNSYLLELDPKNAKAHTEYGKASLFLRRLEDAHKHLRQAVQLKPTDDEPHYFLGLVYRMNGQLPEAKNEFQAAININPEHGKAHGNLGLIHLQEGSLEEAALHLQTAVRINPDDTLARESLADVARARAGKQ